jgi:hypothetical protein
VLLKRFDGDVAKGSLVLLNFSMDNRDKISRAFGIRKTLIDTKYIGQKMGFVGVLLDNNFCFGL